MNEAERIVICKHCGKPEYYGEFRWFFGDFICRDCYKDIYRQQLGGTYDWPEFDGPRPTMEEYEKQENEAN